MTFDPLSAGTVLRSRYKIIQRIGQGGMGCLYQAEDLRLPGRWCAVKEVLDDVRAAAEVRVQAQEQFQREASTLARLDHPNLPKVSDYFSVGERYYLVMDFVPGNDLRSLIEAARQEGRYLSENEVLRWAQQLAEALEYLHGQDPPVVHRDIKPSNLRLTPAGILKLVDFGLVKVMAPDERTITVVRGQGTVAYTPLEQYGGDSGHTDIRSDIYAFGATLYHLLTNTPPVDAKQRFLRPSCLTPPRVLNPAISARVEQAILWAMALHPDERPNNVAVFRQALRPESGLNVFSNGSVLIVQPTIRLPAVSTLVDRYLTLAAAALLLLALILTLFPVP